jgi:retinol dehydrogenase-12
MRFTVADFLRTQWTAIPPVLPAALTGKVVVIVGANTGIGYETAKHVALKRPQRLILACRSKDKGESALRGEPASGHMRPCWLNGISLAIMAETGCATARLMLVDLASFVSVKHFAQALSAEESKVDFLVYNAGIFNLHYEATPDGWESR